MTWAQALMGSLLALLVLGGLSLWMRRRGQQRQMAFVANRNGMPRTYSPAKVGNDASARPWEQHSSFNTEQDDQWQIPSDFDKIGFLQAAKQNFMLLQSAWDKSDIPTLRAMMTGSMLAEIQTQLAERESHAPATPNQTEVVLLEAQLLGMEDLGQDYLASVEFSGMIREDASAGPAAFREVWSMTKPKDGGSGWLVSGVQALA